MEIKFTTSIIEALDVMSQVRGGMIFARTKDTPLSSVCTKVDKPVWTGFRFFHQIKASRVRRTEAVNSTTGKFFGWWKLERKVEFYCAGQLVAIVDLVGMRLDTHSFGNGLDNSSFWGVAKIGYFQLFNAITGNNPENWREVELEPRKTGEFVRY